MGNKKPTTTTTKARIELKPSPSIQKKKTTPKPAYTWTPDQDTALKSLVAQHGKKWNVVAEEFNKMFGVKALMVKNHWRKIGKEVGGGEDGKEVASEQDGEGDVK